MSASAQTLPIIIGYGANFAGTPIVVASLGLHDFGLWAITGALAQYGVLLDLGVSRAVLRYVAIYHSRGQEREERAAVGACATVVALMGCILVALPLLFAPQISKLLHLGEPELAKVLLLSSIGILVTGVLGSVFAGASIGRGRTVAPNVGIAGQRASVVAGGVIAVVVDPSLQVFALGSVAGGAAGFLLVLGAIFVDESEIRIGRPTLAVTRDLIGFSIRGQVLSIAELIIFQSGKLLAGLIIGPSAAGAYELGSRLALGGRAFGTSASAVISAHLTRLSTDGGAAAIRLQYSRLVQRNAAVSNFALLLLLGTSVCIVPAWLGKQSLEVVWVLGCLCVAFAINVSTGVSTAMAFALNQLRLIMVATIGGSILAVALGIPLGHKYGLPGVLMAVATVIVMSSIVGVVLVQRFNQIPFSDFSRAVVGPLTLGSVSAALALIPGLVWFPSDRAAAMGPLAVSALAFCFMYMTLGWALGFLPSLKRPIGRIFHRN